MKTQEINKFFIVGVTLVATLGGLLFGYDTAVISGAVDPLKVFFKLDAALIVTGKQIGRAHV